MIFGEQFNFNRRAQEVFFKVQQVEPKEIFLKKVELAFRAYFMQLL
jgi:hypothetical protein